MVYYTTILRRGGEQWCEHRDAKRRGIYLGLYTDPEGDSCFSIYQFSWIKIKKKLSVNKDVSIDSVSGIIFCDFVANSVRKVYSTDQ